MSMSEAPHAAEIGARLREIVAAHARLDGPLLPILHAVQAEWGHVPRSAIAPLADALNLTTAEVHGVVSFYHDFRDAPAGRHLLKVCRAEACQARGGRGIEDSARDRLGIEFGETTPDGAVTLEPVYCLGLCACGPAAMLDGTLHARLDSDRLDALLAECGA
ncbi:formate dehydrogenase subunit gamma [Wenxinia saemankumensis]|uniref:Formate dehydrogenase gamma subunit n=1 Tax=Wenxinia saemankumensis TaxID=1447782 RepID=A0A1M6GY72_9RHOB|nr:formate dehydrogenase subunit gamma [Wenxinia saemankumensis]SHJ14903.1 formate dehydrogenase gamma subunit [Wenxinia saemankumensis]